MYSGSLSGSGSNATRIMSAAKHLFIEQREVPRDLKRLAEHVLDPRGEAVMLVLLLEPQAASCRKPCRHRRGPSALDLPSCTDRTASARGGRGF